MSKVLTFSTVFPSYHPRKGEPTFFVEKIYAGIGVRVKYLHANVPAVENFLYNHDDDYFTPKYHTIRAGNRWKVGDKFSPRIWSGRPYASKQIIIADDIEVKKVWDFELTETGYYLLNNRKDYDVFQLVENDGLTKHEFDFWFQKPFSGQIICWNETITY